MRCATLASCLTVKVIVGAQGNIPFGAALAQSSSVLPPLNRSPYSVPWLHPDPFDKVAAMTDGEQRRLSAAIPAGVNARHRTSLLDPVQVSDLIGVKERRYLDRTGLQPQSSPVDFMRYAAMNQGGDSLSSFDGFVPVGKDFKILPVPADLFAVGADTAMKNYTQSRNMCIHSSLLQTQIGRINGQRLISYPDVIFDGPPFHHSGFVAAPIKKREDCPVARSHSESPAVLASGSMPSASSVVPRQLRPTRYASSRSTQSGEHSGQVDRQGQG